MASDPVASDPVEETSRFYINVLRGYVDITRKYFESGAPVSAQAEGYLQIVLRLIDQTKDTYFEALAEAGLPTPGTQEPVPGIDLDDPVILAEVERRASESAAAFDALVASILNDEEELLGRSIESLLGVGSVTIVKPQGVVWATVINPGTGDAAIEGVHKSFNGGSGNSVIQLSLIPNSRLRPTLRHYLAAWIANVVRTDESPGHGEFSGQVPR